MTPGSWRTIPCISWRRERRTLGSAPTLSRFENARDRASAWAVNQELVEQFIRSKPKAPAYLILDFDATDTPVHGQQEGRFFHCYSRSEEHTSELQSLR